VESPLGGFNIILMDPAGRTGDVAGQQTYDSFNMPLSNACLADPAAPTTRTPTPMAPAPRRAATRRRVYTCPNDPNEARSRRIP